MKSQTVCLIGGSGFVGRHVANLLCNSGVAVRIPTRRREQVKSELIVLPTAEVIESDINDPQQLERLLAGCDAVINLTGILHEASKGDFLRIHSDLPRKIVDVCRSGDVRRLVHVSALKAAHDAPSDYLRSKAAGEQQIRAAEASMVQTTIFRPSVIFGRDDRFLNLFAKLASLTPIIPLACPNARFQPIFVEDVARAIVNSLDETKTFSRTFDLCGPNVYRLKDLVEYVCAVRGLRRSILPLSARMSYLQAWTLEHLPGQLMTRDNLRSMQIDNVCDDAFSTMFGFEPRALEAIVPGYLAKRTADQRNENYRVGR
jgi:NADH dehydrogenase